MTQPATHRQVGDSALLVDLGDLLQVMALDRALRLQRPAWVLDVIPAARTVLVRFDATAVERQQVSDWINAAQQMGAADGGPPPGTLEIRASYDGPDLAEVAALTRLSEPEVIATHLGATYTVAFCGFAPGFAYLIGLPAALRVSRRSSPRTRVPAGAIAVADEFSAVYPRESPGGWQLIGHTDLTMFDVDRDPPALLAPGMQVRFTTLSG